MSTQFELAFVTDAIDESVEMELVSTVDAFVGGHGNVTIVTLTVPGPTVIDGMHRATATMKSLGIEVRAVHDDIVDRSQIASRLGTSTQAVGNWARGERRLAQPFPDPVILSGGGLWRWQEVADWLADLGRPVDDLRRPTALEVAQMTVLLAAEQKAGSCRTLRYRPSGPHPDFVFTSSVIAVAHASISHATKASRVDLADAANSKRTDFALVS
ncbi:hypothetical protein [Phycicoccus sp. 3266]|uniref:hypothetical protein n=1 Tax=Phycicoccus sp. 3266 TaxID=2817751 RepID=UPI0028600593|nr:hypothetical protein [Phycicoccus sp. 3266]MDR6862164.1 hypothetical protein [Phycicoccus sp. 3266]